MIAGYGAAPLGAEMLAVKLALLPLNETLTEMIPPVIDPVVVGSAPFAPYAYFSANFRISSFRHVQSLFFVIRVPSSFLNGSGSLSSGVADPGRVTLQLAPSSSEALSPRQARITNILASEANSIPGRSRFCPIIS
jgi:hypothetical protein